MIKVVYVSGEQSWVNLFPIIPCSSTNAKMNEMYRSVIIGGLEHPNNPIKREAGFTAMVMETNGKPLYVYTENAASDSYDMKMEFNCSLCMDLLPSFGTVRPDAVLTDEG